MSFFDVAPGTSWAEAARALFLMYWLVPGSAFALLVVIAMAGGDQRPRWYSVITAAALTFVFGPVVFFGSLFGLLALEQWGWYVPASVLAAVAAAWVAAARSRGLFDD
jgi:hypothetical protein